MGTHAKRLLWVHMPRVFDGRTCQEYLMGAHAKSLMGAHAKSLMGAHAKSH